MPRNTRDTPRTSKNAQTSLGYLDQSRDNTAHVERFIRHRVLRITEVINNEKARSKGEVSILRQRPHD